VSSAQSDLIFSTFENPTSARLLTDKANVLTSVSRAKARFLGALCVIITVVAIALSCTDAVGRWGGRSFDLGFRWLLAASNSEDMYWTVRFIAEKSIHLTLFTGLSVALWICGKRLRRRTTYSLIGGLALGVCSELFQSLFPTRDPSVRDVLINWSGIVIGLSLIHIVQGLMIGLSPRIVSPELEVAHPNSACDGLLALGQQLREHSAASHIRTGIRKS
jgi:VanZ family protein